MFPWRQMPSYVTCILDAYPKPPSAINSTTVNIHHLDFNNVNLFLNLSWLHPSEINGIIEIYQLRTGREPLGPDRLDDSNDYSLKITTKVENKLFSLTHNALYNFIVYRVMKQQVKSTQLIYTRKKLFHVYIFR